MSKKLGRRKLTLEIERIKREAAHKLTFAEASSRAAWLELARLKNDAERKARRGAVTIEMFQDEQKLFGRTENVVLGIRMNLNAMELAFWHRNTGRLANITEYADLVSREIYEKVRHGLTEYLLREDVSGKAGGRQR